MKIYSRDIIAIILLLGGFFLIFKGFDGFITAMMALVIGYYFSKRVYEEANGEFK